jgi:CBS domain-containing protein/anti-sigma regulatory factor (Ser/Thr protein kinase)
MATYLKERINIFSNKSEFESLLIHGKVSDFMTKPPITLQRNHTMAEAKNLMRIHRISGIPIVDKIGVLRGIISLENIIIALEKGYINEPVRKYMVKDVEWLLDDMHISAAMQFFNKHEYGRYPVIDREIKVVGVVTHRDLMSFLYKRLGSIYLHNKIRDEKLQHRKKFESPEKIVSDYSFLFNINTTDIDQAGEGSSLFKKFLQEKKFPKDATRRASISLYEAEVNVVIHAGGNGTIRAYLKGNKVYIVITDNGLGIDDIDLAVQPGFTTATDEIRERGFGAGMGLANIKKYTDKLVILSSKTGTKIEMVIVAKSISKP